MSNGNTASPVGPMDFGQMADYFVQAKQAMLRVPELEAQITHMTAQSTQDGNRIASLEGRIHDKENTIDTLTASIRSLEVERDQAQFHGLELEDQMHSIGQLLRNHRSVLTDLMAGGLSEAVAIANQPKPMPEEALPQATTEQADHSGPFVKSEITQSQGAPTQYVENTDTAAGGTTQAYASSVNVPITESHDPELTPRPYIGKRYHDEPRYISRSEWIAGGGTDADYDWRPASQMDRW